MKNVLMTLLMTAAITLPAINGLAQAFVYPAMGQSQEQQSRDQGECHGWAMQQTGFNPLQGSAPPPSGGIIRGAAGGGALGAVGGAIGGNAGRGAAIGAAAGALFGGVRQHRQTQQQGSNTQQMNDAYARAFSACMQGRGYTVR
jgi:hypothetical protein